MTPHFQRIVRIVGALLLAQALVAIPVYTEIGMMSSVISPDFLSGSRRPRDDERGRSTAAGNRPAGGAGSGSRLRDLTPVLRMSLSQPCQRKTRARNQAVHWVHRG
jgi:hypothetical protein